MKVVSGGVLKGVTVEGPFTTTTWPQTWNLDDWAAAGRSAMYERHLWVFAAVTKLARGEARLPRKVYVRDRNGDRSAIDPDAPLAQLMRRPNKTLTPFEFWQWISATRDLHGRAPVEKIRDSGGRVVELRPIHPTRMRLLEDGRYEITGPGSNDRRVVAAADILDRRAYNPRTFTRGTSPLEPLRMTLEAEWAARVAGASFFARGVRPGVVLKHPKSLSDPAQTRLRKQMDELHAGAQNTGRTMLLEEGMEAQVVSLDAEEAAYIDSRKLNREEVCAAFDVAPPVLHILDRATFSNIIEQNRAHYRETMGVRVNEVDSLFDVFVWDEFDPSGRTFVEITMDEVLRGDFEKRADAEASRIDRGTLTINEARRLDNRPPVEGGDVPLVNAALMPLSQAGQQTGQQARMARSVMGRVGRAKSLDDVDLERITTGLDSADARLVADMLASSADLDDFRDRIRDLVS